VSSGARRQRVAEPVADEACPLSESVRKAERIIDDTSPPRPVNVPSMDVARRKPFSVVTTSDSVFLVREIRVV
jgi:hypothetical protein